MGVGKDVERRPVADSLRRVARFTLSERAVNLGRQACRRMLCVSPRQVGISEGLCLRGTSLRNSNEEFGARNGMGGLACLG